MMLRRDATVGRVDEPMAVLPPPTNRSTRNDAKSASLPARKKLACLGTYMLTGRAVASARLAPIEAGLETSVGSGFGVDSTIVGIHDALVGFESTMPAFGCHWARAGLT
jgi:hypothetical protein